MVSDNFKRLPRSFFSYNTRLVAEQILGKFLVRETEEGRIVGKIIEVEAYLGVKDKASHCFGAKRTEKTEIMYMKPGTLYVYYIYGTNFCLNVITEPIGVPCAIFIRKLYPIEGIDLMKRNRNIPIGKNFKNLVDGPSKLCQALNITKEVFNGNDSCSPNSKLYFAEGLEKEQYRISLEKRIGIDYAEEDKDKLLRFIYSTK
jgi:DNA-3-methyladenine glycosylase